VIRVAREHVLRTLDVLRTCGGGVRECVIYWLADLTGTEVQDVIHPEHTATAVGYMVDSAWITTFFVQLAATRRRAVSQVHSHPGDWVGHSSTDDEFGLVPSPGFVSVVCPRFGQVEDSDRFGIHLLGPDGRWMPARDAVEW
jgi:hypothetical protein